MSRIENFFYDHSGKVLIGLTVAVVLAIVLILVMGTRAHSDFVSKCEAAGGHEVSMYQASLCVDSEGRVLFGE